jgi:hypothetical protein
VYVQGIFEYLEKLKPGIDRDLTLRSAVGYGLQVLVYATLRY